MPSNVLFLIDELDLWRGTETHLHRLLRCLMKSDITATVAILGKHGLADAFRGVCRSLHCLNVERVFGLSGAYGVTQIVKLIRDQRSDLVVAYHTAADLLAPLAGALTQVPVISCRRDMGFTKKPIHVRVQQGLNPLIQGMISVSHAVAREVERTEGFPLSHNHVIWNGEDLEMFAPGPTTARQQLGIDARTCVITCVGGLSEVKDHRTLLSAYARVQARHPQTCLLLAGSGIEEGLLRRRAQGLGLNVRFLGQRDDVPDLLRASDIYVQTSTTEGFSNAILQAMATALPVVATAVGGNPEMIDDSCGVLVEPGNVPEVALGLNRLVRDAQLRRGMGLAARQWAVSHGSVATMAQAYAEHFERVIDRAAIRRPTSSKALVSAAA